jgi:phosphoglycolate phosphatase-like HAD superfamily hydrolase
MENNIGMTQKVKVVALDFDGVITCLDVDWDLAIRQASAVVGYDIKSIILFYENNFDTAIFNKVSTEIEKLELEALKKAQLLPCVKEVLQKLSEKHLEIYIVSLQSYRVIKEFLDKHELTSYFKGIITREKCPGKKAQVERIAKEMGLFTSQILLIDDNRRNISLCRELGVTCFHFPGKQNPKDAKKTWDKALEVL